MQDDVYKVVLPYFQVVVSDALCLCSTDVPPDLCTFLLYSSRLRLIINRNGDENIKIVRTKPGKLHVIS